ncbi:MAG: hypothetical protein L0Y58_12035 [Verrucomicrobia subdivision 3 bacterium]|nr:hypothetical protein [Limisphaerales bacterium]
MNPKEEFYIGWQSKAPPGIGSQVRQTVVLLLALAIVLGILLGVAQRTIGVSVFEWGKVKSFSGILKSQPYPHLLVTRPGAKAAPATFSSYYLVKPFKFGFDADAASRLDGQKVKLKGTLIYRANQTMIEVVDGSIEPIGSPEELPHATPAVQPVSLGQRTLVGEIVDSKCYLGVMNPGQLTTHRACAIRCISGGIPPVLLVRQTNGPALYFLLVSRDGSPVNKQVLDIIAEPVEITGEVERQGELLILRADPSTYRRL